MISDDEYLERIVAGIQAITDSASEVSWNEILNGRQFDVVVRFTHGTLRYLVLVEVKNRTRKAGATDLDAFVSKARDQNANKAVFVTAAGFQSGAIEVAKRHAVDLFTVTFDETTPTLSPTMSVVVISQQGAPPPQFEFGEPELAANIDSMRLVYANGTQAEMPSEQTQMRYYTSRTMISDGRSLGELVEARPVFQLALGEQKSETIKIWPARMMTPPDEYFFPAGKLKAINYSYTGRMGRQISGTARVDPAMFTSAVVYTNVLTGEVNRFRLDQLPLGLSMATVGMFYFQEHPLRYYYCAGINGTSVSWCLVESFQNEQLIQLTFTQQIKYSIHMIPVSDKATLLRLNRRLDALRELAG